MFPSGSLKLKPDRQQRGNGQRSSSVRMERWAISVTVMCPLRHRVQCYGPLKSPGNVHKDFCLYPSCKLFVCCYVPPKSPKIAKYPGIIVCFVYTCVSTVMGPTCFQEIKIAERVLGLLSFFNLTCSECCNQMCPMCTHSGPYMRPVYLICSLQGGSLK